MKKPFGFISAYYEQEKVFRKENDPNATGGMSIEERKAEA
jgi:hypothetical protein